jgi:hypothetical protein
MHPLLTEELLKPWLNERLARIDLAAAPVRVRRSALRRLFDRRGRHLGPQSIS